MHNNNRINLPKIPIDFLCRITQWQKKGISHSENSIYQDFWASMVLLNSVAAFQLEADLAVVNRQKDKNLKYQYFARTSDLIVTLRDRFVFAVLYGHPMFTAPEIEQILTTMARAVSPLRLGRSFPGTPKPFTDVNHNLKSHL